MYIDFHVHAFADKIAERAMSVLSATSEKTGLKPFTDGTVSSLRKKLEETGISKAVLLPIATKPSQQTTINNWAAEQCGDFFCSFGTVHPDAPDIYSELERIKSLGLYGIKLHPDYQNFFVDEERMIPVYRKCAELELPVLVHAGFDPISPDLAHCIPEAAAKVFEQVPEMTLILAHGGGMMHWDDVEKYLAGKPGNLYFDVSVIANFIKPEQLMRIIRNHGADRILFGSDCPWDNPAAEIEMIKNLNISQEEKEKIYYKNAMKILKISD